MASLAVVPYVITPSVIVTLSILILISPVPLTFNVLGFTFSLPETTRGS
jgi:hypothetical protein